jgi:hypothetical protein
VLPLPLAWLSGDDLAERNGKTLGFARANQIMADAFADYDLRTRPEATWPPIPRPNPRFPPVPDAALTVAEKFERAGERKGYEQAYAEMMQLERSPKKVSGEYKGKKYSMVLSGRRSLWLMRYAYGDDAWREVRRAIELKSMK